MSVDDLLGKERDVEEGKVSTDIQEEKSGRFTLEYACIIGVLVVTSVNAVLGMCVTIAFLLWLLRRDTLHKIVILAIIASFLFNGYNLWLVYGPSEYEIQIEQVD